MNLSGSFGNDKADTGTGRPLRTITSTPRDLVPPVVRALWADGHGRNFLITDLDKRPYPLVGDRPMTWEHLQELRNTASQLAVWANKKPAGWAQVTGMVSGVVTFDFDGAAGINLAAEWNVKPHRRTGSGGYHLDVTYPAFLSRVPTLNGKGKADLREKWPGLDVKGDGGYAIVWGRSLYGEYVWLRDLEPEPTAAVPDDVWAYLRTCSQAPAVPQHTPPLPFPDKYIEDVLLHRALSRASDGRNQAGFWLACQLRDNGYGEAQALAVGWRFVTGCSAVNTKGQLEPYTIHDFTASVRSAYTRAPRLPGRARR